MFVVFFFKLYSLTPLSSSLYFEGNDKIKQLIDLDFNSIITYGEFHYKKYKQNSIKEIINSIQYEISLSNTTNQTFKFLVCLGKNAKYRNYIASELSDISAKLGYSEIGGFLYFVKYQVIN